jgi:hypothetical protein
MSKFQNKIIIWQQDAEPEKEALWKSSFAKFLEKFVKFSISQN